MDLLGRKVTMKKGAAVKIFIDEIKKAIDEAGEFSDLKTSAVNLSEALTLWKDTTNSLLGIAARGEIDLFLADATLYLELSGIVCIAWQWLLQGIAVQKMFTDSASGSSRNFADGKMYALKYFYGYELPKIHGLAMRLKNADGITLKMQPEHFED
jgi:butyryl-CoA dehydrogenase